MRQFFKIEKSILSLLLIISISFCCVGCQTDNEKEMNFEIANVKETVVNSGIVAQDGENQLFWDNQRVALLWYKGDKLVWSSLPETQYNNPSDGGVGMRLESHLVVQYVNGETGLLDTEYSQYAANENGRVFSEKIDNGIKITYCMDSCYIAIPVEYSFKDGYLSAKINTSEIYEDGSQIYKITIMPYGVSKNSSEDSFLFLPDGCGMTVSTKQDKEFNYSGKVYGRDYTISYKYSFNNTADVKLPVFGSFGGSDNNCCCIIDGTEGSAEIVANFGNADIGYAYAAATFNLRGSEVVTHSQKWGAVTVDNSYSDIIKGAQLSVRFYPMNQESDCSDIAEIYRNYLIKEKKLSKNSDDKILYLNAVMAASKRKFYFGYPVDKTISLTTYSQIDSIIKDIETKTGNLPVVRLEGAQDGGIEIKKVAGGYRLESMSGKSSELSDLCKKYEIYPDFDLIRFKNSGNGIKVSKDAAVNATSLKSLQYFMNMATGTIDSNQYKYVLLSPLKFNSAAEKLFKELKKWDINTVSLSTLGYMNYSDYRYNQSYVSSLNPTITLGISTNFKKNKIDIMYDSANAYAAVCAKYIVNSPSITSNYSYQHDWFPFYQMVFKGYVSLAGEPLNLSDNSIYNLLYAAQTGSGLMFTVTGNDIGTDFVSSQYKSLSCGSYDMTSPQIKESLEIMQEVFGAVKNASLISFKRIEKDLYRSDFDNGISVIVNYGNKDKSYKNLTIKAKNFIYKSFNDGEETK